MIILHVLNIQGLDLPIYKSLRTETDSCVYFTCFSSVFNSFAPETYKNTIQ
jgi:hypothetical protein